MKIFQKNRNLKFSKNRTFAFTMAELLIGMTIIGILAAIILAGLNSNLNERLWKTKRQALYTRLQQAMSQLSGMNGYGVYNETDGVDNAAEAFITKGLGQHLKLNHICAVDYNATDEQVREALEQCGISKTYQNQAGGTKNFPTKYSDLNGYTAPKTHVAAFQTVNDDSVAILYNNGAADGYNPALKDSSGNFYIFNVLSAIFIYDLNGLKGPNKLGEDMGIFAAIFSSDPDLLYINPLPYEVSRQKNLSQAKALCRAADKTSHIPSFNEAIAIRAIRSIDTSFNSSLAVWINQKGFFAPDKYMAFFYDETHNYYGPADETSSLSVMCNRSLFKKK